MKQSSLFPRTRKTDPSGEPSVNARLLIRAGFVDKLMAGAYTLLPLGLRVVKNIENIIRDEMNKLESQELVMPSLHPKENWEKTGRWTAMDDLYTLSDASKREFALGPTHEEIVVPLAKSHISSYKDFPFALYQFQNKFRMELRAKSGVLRGREFIMKDLYSFHLYESDLDQYYDRVKEAYERIFIRTGIGHVTHLTFASGGTFSKYSHEFQAECEAGEDIIFVCDSCGVAVNQEVKDEVPKCPECAQKSFTEKKSVEVGNIFKLKDKYTKPFDFRVKDRDGNDTMVVMGCYGIGLQRLMGTVVEVLHDEKGIVWPESIAPFRVHLISLAEHESLVRDAADEIYALLGKSGIDVLYDDRSVRAGEKFADADLLGIPIRIVISKRTLASQTVEWKRRTSGETETVPIAELVNRLS